jgi:hypothetical protein
LLFVECFKALSATRIQAGSVMVGWWTNDNLEIICRDLIEVQSRNLPIRSEENHGRCQWRFLMPSGDSNRAHRRY